jgi:exopolysaccharide biosynthesis WecB/TagA/CpsF family protein
MKSHVANAVFGALDYLAYPAGLLLLAPEILATLGVDRYGIWSMSSAALTTGAIVASGFGDANIRFVALARGSDRRDDLLDTVRSSLALHLALGVVIAGIAWFAAPALTRHAVEAHRELATDCLWSLRITAVLVLLRAVETVCVSTQRAFGRYGTSFQVSAIARIVSLLIAWILPFYCKSVAAVMVATLATNSIALSVQFWQLNRLLGTRRLTPLLHPGTMRVLLGFGVFTWLQAVSGLAFGQVDRLVAGVALGTSALTAYTFCAQLTQPIYGLTAAGLHFLFPHLVSSGIRDSSKALRRSVLGAFTAGFIFVAMSVAGLFLYGPQILHLWAGPSVAPVAASVLPMVAVGSGLSALSVAGCYSLLALGKPRAVTTFNIIGGIAMALALYLLIPRLGLAGIAYGRLLPGLFALFVYFPLGAVLLRGARKSNSASEPTICEEVKNPGPSEFAPGTSGASEHSCGESAVASQLLCANVLGVAIDAINMEQALALAAARLQYGPKGYVCAVSVHGILEALHSDAVADALQHASISLPDGTPTVWVGRAQGFRFMRHVTGPALMQEIFSQQRFSGFSHFFYGGKPGIAEELAATLRRQYPWVKVAGTYTPPFRELTPHEESDLIQTINRLKPGIIWVGISTPRQDLFMRRMLPHLDTRLMFGVGAAFDFLTGHIRPCPEWMKRAGLHWLHRLAQDPARLWRRNLQNSAFLWHIAIQLAHLRAYPLRREINYARSADHAGAFMPQRTSIRNAP